MNRGYRNRVFAVAATGLLATCVALGWIPALHENVGLRIAGYFILLPLGLSVVLLWPATLGRRASVLLLLGIALLTRLVMLPHPVDSDMNRYLWEGKLVRHGESPYAHTATAPEWQPLRDQYWEGMNQKDLRTIYPPLTEWVFAATGGIWYHPIALKLLFLGFDLGTVGLLATLLTRRALPVRFAGFYAFNPVPLVGFAGEGHFDAMLLFFVLLALWLRERGQPGGSWAALALAVQVKLIAVLLVPLFFFRGGWRRAWIFGLVAGVPFLVYHSDLRDWLEGVRHFGADLAFNGSVHALAWMALDDRTAAASLCAVLLLGWTVVVALTHADPVRGAFWTLGGLIVLSPTVHYWYLGWALIFLPLMPSLAWITLSGVMALYFLVASEVQAGRAWGLPSWAQVTIWTVFGVLLLREALIAVPPMLKRKILHPPPVRTLAIVIPTLNEGVSLRRCLDSVQRLVPRPDEIIVADGGSVDDTVAVAKSQGAGVVVAPRGRGRQIAAGAARASSDVVLVLHADSIVRPDSGRSILAALNAQDRAVGGAIGQHFDADTVSLLAVEAFNEIRALFFGASFGDQGQFFRRATIAAGGGFPALPLMEDVEFSRRLRVAGPSLYLGGGVVCSARRWQRDGWLRRFWMVLALTAEFRLRRGNIEACAEALYRKYYGKPAPGAPVNPLAP